MYRTGERLLPSMFQRSQQAAQGMAGDLVEGLRPDLNAGQLLTNARATGDVIPLTSTAQKVAALDREIVANPTNPADTIVRAQLKNLTVPTQTTTAQMSVSDVLAHLADIGPSVGKSPRSAALYGALLDDLEAAAKSGSGSGAAMARAGLDAGRQNLGAQRLQDILANPSVTRTTSIGGANVPALNVSNLRNAIAKDKDI